MPSQIEGNYDSAEYERQLKGEMNCRATASVAAFWFGKRSACPTTANGSNT
jgi:hypothetical protein